MTSRAETDYRYEKLTWPEINDAVEMGQICIVPCGAVEQHGAHLPLDVDLVCPTGISRGESIVRAIMSASSSTTPPENVANGISRR